MPQRDSFSTYHPLVNFAFFGLVIFFSMFLMHPGCLLISLFSASLYHLQLLGKKALRLQLACLPVALMAALLNPTFNHQGVTILRYLPSGNPLTLESILYGFAASAMLASVLLWFSCYTAVMSSDKFVYLFGRIIPALSLILSMSLRYIPRFQQQAHEVRQAQAMVGRDITQGTLLHRLRHAVTIFSILLTWSLENAIETADSMKARGYGLPGRSAFSIYRIEERDRHALLWLFLLGVSLLIAWRIGGFYWAYYPAIVHVNVTGLSVGLLLLYFSLCITPVLINEKERLSWNRL